MNKLNLALVQVRPLPLMLVFVLICWLDFEARVAAQLADVHLRARRVVQDQPLPLREQHGYLEAALRGNL